MHADVPKDVRAKYLGIKKALAEQKRKELAEQKGSAEEKEKEKEKVESPSYFWRLADPKHEDVQRATKLLQAVIKKSHNRFQTKKSVKFYNEMKYQAAHWLADLERNNSILTFDVAGGYDSGAAVPIVMDVRNVDHVKFSLYRVRSAKDLVDTNDRIGDDFVFFDYGLQFRGLLRQQHVRMHDVAEELQAMSDRLQRPVHAPPKFAATDLVKSWSVDAGTVF